MLDDEDCIKTVFLHWGRYFYDNLELCKDNMYRAPIFHLMITACDLGLNSVLRDFVEGNQDYYV